jgi:hypothetical protein
VSDEERALQEKLDMERYLALEWDEIRVEEQEGGLCLEVEVHLFTGVFLLYRRGEEKAREWVECCWICVP